MRNIGAVFSELWEQRLSLVELGLNFDGIVFVEESNPSRPLVSCPRSSFNNFSDSDLFVLSGAKDLYVPNYQTVGAIFARWLSIKMTATATFLETFFCKELMGHDTRSRSRIVGGRDPQLILFQSPDS